MPDAGSPQHGTERLVAGSKAITLFGEMMVSMVHRREADAFRRCFSRRIALETGKKDTGGSRDTHRDTQDTRAQTGTRITQANLTTIQTGTCTSKIKTN